MTLLCLDSGNSRLKWGLHAAAAWQARGALPTTEISTLWQHLPAQPRPTRVLACNVAGEGAQQALLQVARTLGVALEWSASRTEQCGVSNGYSEPTQLGADRWAALIGARGLRQTASLVVVAGTATTIDLLDAGGVFRGGLIVPGLALMRDALARQTANLPALGGSFSVLPRNTADGIASGCLQATLGAIERMYAQCADQPGAMCILSGGAAAAIAPLLTLPLLQVDDLVLEGLARQGSGIS